MLTSMDEDAIPLAITYGHASSTSDTKIIINHHVSFFIQAIVYQYQYREMNRSIICATIKHHTPRHTHRRFLSGTPRSRLASGTAGRRLPPSFRPLVPSSFVPMDNTAWYLCYAIAHYDREPEPSRWAGYSRFEFHGTAQASPCACYRSASLLAGHKMAIIFSRKTYFTVALLHIFARFISLDIHRLLPRLFLPAMHVI